MPVAKTRANLETSIRYKLDTQTSGGLWSDTLLDEYIYRSALVAWPLLPDSAFNSNVSLFTTQLVSTTVLPAASVEIAALPTNCMRVLSLRHYVNSTTTYKGVVILPDAGALWRKHGLSNNWTSGVDTTYGVVEGNSLMVGPIALSDSISVHYLKWPTEMASDSSTLEAMGLNDEHSNAIEDYAVYLALRQVESPKATVVLQNWKENMATLWQSLTNKPLPAYLAPPGKK